MTSQFDPETAGNNEEIEQYVFLFAFPTMETANCVADSSPSRQCNKPVHSKRRAQLMAEIYWNLLEKVRGSELKLTKCVVLDSMLTMKA